MRKILSCLVLFCVSVSAWSQFSVGAGATYTQFNGRVKKSTHGFQTRLLYEKRPYGIVLGYSYYAPLRLQTWAVSNSSYPEPTQHAETELTVRIQSINLFILRTILGSGDTKAKLYGGLGASWEVSTYKETPKAPLTFTPIFPLEDNQYRGLNINGMLGSEYKLGRISIFGEASYSIPTKARYMNSIGDFNIAAPRQSFQIGIKLKLHK
ncbi:hypothetical protein HRG84_23815 [Flavisolibacter sp. BT320]|nr:hypothetical protein [Flavisolibacter longurius]